MPAARPDCAQQTAHNNSDPLFGSLTNQTKESEMLDQNLLLPTAEDLRIDISKHLKLSIGKDPEHASLYDWRMSLSLALRDRVVEPWFASTRKTYEGKHKRVYYLSMEFLIGRLIEDVTIRNSIDR